MIALLDFDLSLKIMWLQKLRNSKEEWEEFATLNNVERLIWTGERDHGYLLETQTNPFWKSVASAYKIWYQSILKVNPPDINYKPINRMNIPFNNKLFSNGLISLGDLIDDVGNYLSKPEVETRIGCLYHDNNILCHNEFHHT